PTYENDTRRPPPGLIVIRLTFCCHSERSEGSTVRTLEILRFAQDDKGETFVPSSLDLIRVALHCFLPRLQVLQVNASAAGDARERVFSELHVQARRVAHDGREAA